MKALSSGSCQCHRDPTLWVILSLPLPLPPNPVGMSLSPLILWVVLLLFPWGMMHLVHTLNNLIIAPYSVGSDVIVLPYGQTLVFVPSLTRVMLL